MAKILDPDLLTYSVNGTTGNLRFDTAAKTIELVAGGSLVAKDGVTGQCLFSKIKEVLRADAVLPKYPLPVREMIHDESMELVNGWTFKDASTLKMVRDCGVAYVNAAGVVTAMYACFVTLGQVASGAPYYTLSSATNAATAAFTHVNLGTTFGVNELVQIYQDTNGDGTPDFDYRSYAKVFLREQGYTYDESSNVDIGYAALTYKKYNFPITHSVDPGVTVDDATLASYAGLAIEWFAAPQAFSLGSNGPYNYHVVITAAGKTESEIYSWVQYRLRQAVDIDAGAGNRTGNVTPSLVFMDGTTLKTKLQPQGGIHIVNPAGASLNNIAEADDGFTGTFRTYPYVAAITLEFDSFLQADGANAKYWLWDAATYGTAGATLLQDNTGTPITGTVGGASASFGFNYPGAPVNYVAVAVGKGNGKTAVQSGTILATTANKAVLVAGQERWYLNP